MCIYTSRSINRINLKRHELTHPTVENSQIVYKESVIELVLNKTRCTKNVGKEERLENKWERHEDKPKKK